MWPSRRLAARLLQRSQGVGCYRANRIVQMHLDVNPGWRAEPPGWGFVESQTKRYNRIGAKCGSTAESGFCVSRRSITATSTSHRRSLARGAHGRPRNVRPANEIRASAGRTAEEFAAQIKMLTTLRGVRPGPRRFSAEGSGALGGGRPAENCCPGCCSALNGSQTHCPNARE